MAMDALSTPFLFLFLTRSQLVLDILISCRLLARVPNPKTSVIILAIDYSKIGHEVNDNH